MSATNIAHPFGTSAELAGRSTRWTRADPLGDR